MKNVKIAVLRKQLYEDIAEEYLTDGKDIECDYYEEGDIFSLYRRHQNADRFLSVGLDQCLS